MTEYGRELLSNASLKGFIKAFYKQTDTKPPLQADPYVDYFTEQATLILGSKEAKGAGQIAQLRQDIWAGVKGRHHVVNNVASVNDSEILINGYVDYVMIDGKELTKPWAAYMVFDSPTQDKIRYYQVYLDSSVPQSH